MQNGGSGDNDPQIDDPVTAWIDELRNADASAAGKLWNHFVSRLRDCARKKLHSGTRSVYDDDDAVQSAFHSVCAGIAAGRFPDLRDRESLLRLLLVITSRKIARRHAYDHRQRRDVRRNVSNRIFVDSADDLSRDAVQQLPSREPTPEFAAEFAETCETLFQRLDDPQLQQVVTLRMEGYTDSEIGARLKCSRRSVQRSLEVVRRQWSRQECIDE